MARRVAQLAQIGTEAEMHRGDDRATLIRAGQPSVLVPVRLQAPRCFVSSNSLLSSPPARLCRLRSFTQTGTVWGGFGADSNERGIPWEK